MSQQDIDKFVSSIESGNFPPLESTADSGDGHIRSRDGIVTTSFKIGF